MAQSHKTATSSYIFVNYYCIVYFDEFKLKMSNNTYPLQVTQPISKPLLLCQATVKAPNHPIYHNDVQQTQGLMLKKNQAALCFSCWTELLSIMLFFLFSSAHLLLLISSSFLLVLKCCLSANVCCQGLNKPTQHGQVIIGFECC